MRDSDSDRDRRLSRRQYAQILAGISTVGLAGCGGDSGDTPTAADDDTPTEADGDGGDTPTAADGDGGDTPTETEETPTNTPAEPVTDRMRVGVDNTPGEFDINPWTPQDNTTGDRFLMELNGLNVVDDTVITLSGTTVETPHKRGYEEVELMTWIEDYSVEAPFDWRQSFDDRATYWNGDPYDAEALVAHNHVAWFRNGNKFVEGSTFNQEAEDQWTRHGWFNKGDVPNQEANPVALPILESEVATPIALLFNPPIHPDFTEPYLERYRNAGTSEEVNSISGDLSSDRIPLERLAENGWGSGMYELQSTDDIGSEGATLHIRGDHPNAEHTNVDRLELLWASEDRRQTLQTNGRIDFEDGIVSPQSSTNREALPDHMQELVRWLNPTTGNQWLMNWHNKHLSRLWVRRALVEAIDWRQVSVNGWGDQGAAPVSYDTYLLDAEAESTFSEDFLDQLHTYSRGQNLENANEYMRRAGYSREGDEWVGPDGDTATLQVMAQGGNNSAMNAGQTITQTLRSWGVVADFEAPGFGTWSNRLNPEDQGLDFDTSIFWSDTPTVFGKYNDRGAWWGEALYGGSPTAGSVSELTAEDEVDTQNKPVTVELPQEVGSIEAPDQAGRNPDLENGREVDMFEVVNGIRNPENSEEEIQELYRTCAQYYNFYVPDFLFNQTVSGAWGNVRDFDWPDDDARALRLGRNLSVSTGNIMTGLVQASTDTEFESPD